jgi:hypothetical protein
MRGDFNTLDNPFHYSSDPTADRYRSQPAAGLHFLMFQPTIEIFNSVRLAMALSGYGTPRPTAFVPCRDRLGPADDPSSELLGPTPSPSLLSVGGIPQLTSNRSCDARTSFKFTLVAPR